MAQQNDSELDQSTGSQPAPESTDEGSGQPVAGESETTSDDADTARIERIDRLVGLCRGNWFGLLAYLAFVGVTLLGVVDADFFMPQRQTPLPLIGVTVPTNLFFYVAPFLGAMLYVHLHVYLLKLWKVLAEAAPERNGQPLGERAHPWIVVDLALLYRRGAMHPYPLQGFLRWVVLLLVFAAAPFILAGFWWRSMPKHDELLTVVFCGLPLITSLYTGFSSFLAMRRAMRSEPPPVGRRLPWRVGWVLLGSSLTILGWLTTEGTLAAYARIGNIRFLSVDIEFTSLYQRRYNALAKAQGGMDKSKAHGHSFYIPEFSGTGTVKLVPGDAPSELATLLLAQKWWMTTWWPQLLVSADLQGVEFVATPEGWEDYAQAEQSFRSQWCAEYGLNAHACIIGWEGLDIGSSPFDDHHRRLWCEEVSGFETDEGIELPVVCRNRLAALKSRYRLAWREHRRRMIAGLPYRDLRGTDLRRAKLGSARLEGGDLRGARLAGADLGGAQLEGANLGGAQLQRANLRLAQLQGAYLGGAQLQGADLVLTQLQGASLDRAQLQTANLGLAQLQGANLNWAQLQETGLVGTQLQGAGLFETQLQGANLYKAEVDASTDLRAANFSFAGLRDVDLSEWPITQQQLDSSFGDGSVILRDLHRPVHWPIGMLDRYYLYEWEKWRADSEAYQPPSEPPEPVEPTFDREPPSRYTLRSSSLADG